MLPIQADTLVRLDRPAELQQAIDRCAAAETEPDRFTSPAVAAARFRLAPSEATAAAAERAAAAAPWPWLHAQVGCWRGEFLGDAEAVASARDQFEAIEALRGVERADATLHRLGRRAHHRGRPPRSSRPASSRSPSSSPMGSPTLRSPPACSSAGRPCPATSPTSSPSWASRPGRRSPPGSWLGAPPDCELGFCNWPPTTASEGRCRARKPGHSVLRALGSAQSHSRPNRSPSAGTIPQN